MTEVEVEVFKMQVFHTFYFECFPGISNMFITFITNSMSIQRTIKLIFTNQNYFQFFFSKLTLIHCYKLIFAYPSAIHWIAR